MKPTSSGIRGRDVFAHTVALAKEWNAVGLVPFPVTGISLCVRRLEPQRGRRDRHALPLPQQLRFVEFDHPRWSRLRLY